MEHELFGCRQQDGPRRSRIRVFESHVTRYLICLCDLTCREVGVLWVMIGVQAGGDGSRRKDFTAHPRLGFLVVDWLGLLPWPGWRREHHPCLSIGCSSITTLIYTVWPFLVSHCPCAGDGRRKRCYTTGIFPTGSRNYIGTDSVSSNAHECLQQFPSTYPWHIFLKFSYLNSAFEPSEAN